MVPHVLNRICGILYLIICHKKIKTLQREEGRWGKENETGKEGWGGAIKPLKPNNSKHSTF